jgi:hypothetical protein
MSDLREVFALSLLRAAGEKICEAEAMVRTARVLLDVAREQQPAAVPVVEPSRLTVVRG